MSKKKVPRRIWDRGLVYEAEIMSRTAAEPNGRTGFEEIFGATPDISQWLDFEFYDLVWYWDHERSDMAEENRKLGRWLGISHNVGSDLCYWILPQSCKVIARSTVCHVLREELLKPETKLMFEVFGS